MEKKNIWKICSIISIVIIVILSICLIVISTGKKEAINNISDETPKTTTNTAKHNDDMIRISLDEDFSKDGTIEGIENVRWSDARIRQYDNEMEIYIMLNNDSETEVIEARTLEMVLLDKEGKQIIAKDIEMGEIPAKYGYTTLETTIENIEPLLVYDVQLKAK